MSLTDLPVPVLQHPHWRVNVRQQDYVPKALPSLSDCFNLIQATKVSLRGWDYPHLSPKPEQRGTGNDWVASWTTFMQYIAYWRLFQSGQFIHLFAVKEAMSSEWRVKLQHAAASHASYRDDIDWNSVPGYFSLLNVLYTVTEVFEFAARVTQRGVYSGNIEVTIELKGVKGFVLTPDLDRAWSEVRMASEDIIGHTWLIGSTELVSTSAAQSLAATSWFFERFGWLQPATTVLQRDQAKFLAGLR